MIVALRQAHRADIGAMHRVRMSVRENRLVSSVIADADYITAIEKTGRGWVVEEAGEVVAFAVGNAVDGNVWALFVQPEHEGRGFGRRLHDVMVRWLFARGVPRLWLTTGADTRAERFYRAAGWRFVERLPSGEALYELRDPEAR
jgi:GNAT superfamily N-acetyltransferase